MKLTKKQIYYTTLIICIVIIAIQMIEISRSIQKIVMSGGLLFLFIILYQNAELVTGLEKGNIRLAFYKRLIIVLGIVILLLTLVIPESFIDSSLKSQSLFGNYMVSLAILLLSNYFPKIPHNQYIGLRLPWTVRDADVWHYAHRLAGFIGMVCAVIQICLLPFIDASIVMPITIFGWVLISGIMSYIYYKKKRGKTC